MNYILLKVQTKRRKESGIMAFKDGYTNPMQKGERRQRLHGNQNNVGNSENKPEYKNFNGDPIK